MLFYLKRDLQKNHQPESRVSHRHYWHVDSAGIPWDRVEHLVNHKEVRHLVDDSGSSSRNFSSVKSLDQGGLGLLSPPHRLQDNCPCLLLEVFGLQHTLVHGNNPPPHDRHLCLPLQKWGDSPFQGGTSLLCCSLSPRTLGLPSRRAIPSPPDEENPGLH